MELGSSFLIPEFSGPGHLWVVTSRPDTPLGAAIFMLSTLRDHSKDRTCILRPGEHEFVHHDTVVAYQRGVTLTVAEHEALRKMGCCQLRTPFKPHVLARIQRGALASDFTPEKLKPLVAETLRAAE